MHSLIPHLRVLCAWPGASPQAGRGRSLIGTRRALSPCLRLSTDSPLTADRANPEANCHFEDTNYYGARSGGMRETGEGRAKTFRHVHARARARARARTHTHTHTRAILPLDKLGSHDVQSFQHRSRTLRGLWLSLLPSSERNKYGCGNSTQLA